MTIPASATMPSSTVTMPRSTRASRFIVLPARSDEGTDGTSVGLSDGEVQHESAEEGFVAQPVAACSLEPHEPPLAIASVLGDDEEILDEPRVVAHVDPNRTDR